MNNSKTILSRLLSKENISVEVGNFHTASFDLIQRTLNLPDWGITNKRVLDHLIGHEISHALNTSIEMWEAPQKKYGARVKGIVNVIEDIRIERLVLQTYPGLKRDFRESYDVLVNEMDLFQTKGEDINALSFINRLNLYAKGGIYGLYDIEFDAEEKAFVDKCFDAETEQDVLDLVDEFVAKWGMTKPEESGEEGSEEGSEGSEEGSEGSEEGSEGSEEGSEEGDESGEDSGDEGSEASGDSEEDSGDEGSEASGDSEEDSGDEGSEESGDEGSGEGEESGDEGSGEGEESGDEGSDEGDEGSGEGDDDAFDCSTQDKFDSFGGEAGEGSEEKPKYREDAFDCSTQDKFDEGLKETISKKTITKIPSRKVVRKAIRRLVVNRRK